MRYSLIHGQTVPCRLRALSGRYLDRKREVRGPPRPRSTARPHPQDGEHWTLAGELTVRQVNSPVTLTVESVEPAGAGFRARATTRIDRYAFGLTSPSTPRPLSSSPGRPSLAFSRARWRTSLMCRSVSPTYLFSSFERECRQDAPARSKPRRAFWWARGPCTRRRARWPSGRPARNSHPDKPMSYQCRSRLRLPGSGESSAFSNSFMIM
jgi:hypothetical protein